MRIGHLRPLYERGRPPFSTVWLETTHNTPEAGRHIDLRWRAARDRLVEQGAPDDVCAALDAAVGPAELAGHQSQLLVAADGQVLLDEHLPVRPNPEVARTGPLPHLLPWLVAPRRPPYMLVLIDRTGADITIRTEQDHEVVTVEGDRYPIEKNAPGGWSQRRYQQAAEETWQHNSGRVAAEVDRLHRRHPVPVVMVGGDVRALAALLDKLPEAVRSVVVELDDVGRAAGVSREALERRVAGALDRWQQAEVGDLIAEFEQERGQRDRAAEEFAAVAEAARQGQVDTLLVNGPVLDDLPPVWIGPAAEQFAGSRDEVAALGVPDPVRERADAALVRAVAATDGAVRYVDPARLGLKDGVAALLRYAARPA